MKLIKGLFGMNENDFPILRCLVKQGGKIRFQRKINFPKMKENIFHFE